MHAAGIRVKMITGDHAVTARAIARQIGLKDTDRVVSGVDIDGMNDAELLEVAVTSDSFARTSPAHKLSRQHERFAKRDRQRRAEVV